MQLANPVRLGAWILIIMNLLMAASCIWVFSRMSPALGNIASSNAKIVQSCNEMLWIIARVNNKKVTFENASTRFSRELDIARSRIGNSNEQGVFQLIEKSYLKALQGDRSAQNRTIKAIRELSQSVTSTIISGNQTVTQLALGGAWSVVFIASGLFTIGLVFLKIQKRILILPLEEIRAVLVATRNGDMMRRCYGNGLTSEIRYIYSNLNDLLDRVASKSSDLGDIEGPRVT